MNPRYSSNSPGSVKASDALTAPIVTVEPVGEAPLIIGSRANVDLISPALRKAYVAVEADAACKLSVTVRNGFPLMCHVHSGDPCRPVISAHTNLLEQNSYSPIYYSVDGATRQQVATADYPLFLHTDVAQRPCAQESNCAVIGGAGANLFTGTLRLEACVAKCQDFSATNVNRSCTYDSRFNVKQ